MSEFQTPPPPEATGSQETFNPNEYTVKEILKPDHTALLVVDVQNDFVHPEGKFKAWGRDIDQMQSTIPHINSLVDEAHTAGVPVIFTQGFEDVKYRSGPDLRRAVKWDEKPGDGSVNSEEGTFGAEFYPDLRIGEEDTIVTKHKWSAFDGKTKDGKTLKEVLDAKGIRTLVVTGVVAETCVETTMRDAYNQGYFTVVPKNSVGSNQADQLEARMKYWEAGFLGTDILDEAEIAAIWQEAAPAKTEGLDTSQAAQEKFTGNIEPLAEEDLPELREILEHWLQDFGRIATDEVDGDIATMREALREGSSKKMFVAKSPEGKVIGMMGLSFQPKEPLRRFAKTDAPGELIIAYVHPDYRMGKGTGTALINMVQNLAKSLGKKEILLESGPRHRETGYPFYDKQPGFERVEPIRDFYGPGLDTMVWRKIF